MKRFLLALMLLVPVVPVASATHDPNDFFALEAQFPGIIWNDIHGTSSTNIFAVGQTAAGASAVAYRGTGSWILQSVPNIGPIRQVWVESASLALVVGVNPSGTANVLRWNGATWAVLGTNNLFTESGVWGISSTNAVVFDRTSLATPAFRRYTGTLAASTLCPAGAGNSEDYGDVFAIPGLGTYIFGGRNSVNPSQAKIHRFASPYASTDCSSVNVDGAGAIADFWDVSGTLAGAWGVGDNGVIIQGSTIQTSPTMFNLDAIWGLSETDIWAVGAGGTIIHKGAGDWTTEPSITGESLTGVYCSDALNCWITSALGNIFKLQVNANSALPSLAGLIIERDNFNAVASHAQCLGDEVSLRMVTDQAIGAGGIIWYILNSDSNVVVETGTQTSFFNLNDRLFHTSRVYPAGDYQFLATIDIQGALAQDVFSDHPFNVPAGTCLTAQDKVDLDDHCIPLQDDCQGSGTGGSFIEGTTLGQTTVENVLLLLLAFLVVWYIWAKTTEWGFKFIMPLMMALLFLATLSFVDKWQPLGYLAAMIAASGVLMMFRSALDFTRGQLERRSQERERRGKVAFDSKV